MSKYGRLKRAVKNHGEVHAYVEELGEVEMRSGQTDFHRSDNMVSVYDGKTRIYIDIDHVIGWYKPMEAFHD